MRSQPSVGASPSTGQTTSNSTMAKLQVEHPHSCDASLKCGGASLGYHGETGRHDVDYDDGTMETLSLSSEKIIWKASPLNATTASAVSHDSSQSCSQVLRATTRLGRHIFTNLSRRDVRRFEPRHFCPNIRTNVHTRARANLYFVKMLAIPDACPAPCVLAEQQWVCLSLTGDVLTRRYLCAV